MAHKFKDKGIKFIKLSDELPGFCICVNNAMAEKDKHMLTTALTALTDTTSEGTAILNSIYKRYTAFKETSDAEYDTVRIMMSKLGLI